MDGIQKALDAVAADIDWGNWEVEEVDRKLNSEGTDGFWKVTEVLHCKLEWLYEAVFELSHQPGFPEGHFDEHISTISDLQSILAAIKPYEK